MTRPGGPPLPNDVVEPMVEATVKDDAAGSMGNAGKLANVKGKTRLAAIGDVVDDCERDTDG